MEEAVVEVEKWCQGRDFIRLTGRPGRKGDSLRDLPYEISGRIIVSASPFPSIIVLYYFFQYHRHFRSVW